MSAAPYWKPTFVAQLKSPALDAKCDVLIIGAGIVGLTAALELQKIGLNVIVACKTGFGESATSYSAGILTQETTVDLHQLSASFGTAKVSSYLQELMRVLNETFEEFRADDSWFFKGGSLYFAAKHEHQNLIQSELSIRNQFKLSSTLLSPADMHKYWSKFPLALRIDGDFAVNPMSLQHAIAEKFCAAGGLLCEFAPVFEPTSYDGKNYKTAAGSYNITSSFLVDATGSKSSTSKGFERKSTCVAITERSAKVAELVKEMSVVNFWDSHENYVYGRYLKDGRMLLGGLDGAPVPESTVLSNADHSVMALMTWASEHHNFAIPSVEYAWRANLALPHDGMPYLNVKKEGRNISIKAITDGLPNGLLLGRLIASRIQNLKTPLDEFFKS